MEVKTYARGSVFVTAEQVIFLTAFLIGQMVFTRYVPQSELGVYALSYTLLTFLILVADFGFVDAISVYERKKLRSEIDFSRVLRFRIWSGVLITILIFFSSFFLADFYSSPLLGHVVRIASLFFLGMVMAYTFMGYLRSRKMFKEYAFSKISGTIIGISLSILFVLNGFDVVGIWIGLIIGAMITMFLAFFFAFSRGNTYRDIGQTRSIGQGVLLKTFSIRKMIVFSLPIQIQAIIHMLYDTVGIYIIGALFRKNEIALYFYALNFIIAASVLAQAFAFVMLPAFSSKGGYEGINLLSRSMKMMSLLLLPIVVIYFAFSAIILRLFYGESFVPASSILKILSLVLIFRYVNIVYQTFFISQEMAKKVSIVRSFGLVINIVGIFLLSSFLGLEGVALSFVISEAICCLFYTMMKVTSTFKVNISWRRFVPFFILFTSYVGLLSILNIFASDFSIFYIFTSFLLLISLPAVIGILKLLTLEDFDLLDKISTSSFILGVLSPVIRIMRFFERHSPIN